MRLSFGQELRQVQKQILAPRMIQSMEILQLPIMALQERILQELQENPTLEMQERDPDLPDESIEIENPDAPTLEERELVVDEKKDNEDDFERLVDMDQEFPDFFEERSKPSSNRLDEIADRQHDIMANMVNRPQTLQDHLHEQLADCELPDDVREMADRIIYNLAPDGRLPVPLEDLLPPQAGPEQIEVARQALRAVQNLDPKGVAARDLKECLLLQLDPEDPLFEEVRMLITNHLEDLEHNRLPAISKKTGWTIEEIHEIWDELRKLNPKPGAEFQEPFVPNVTPDVFLDPTEEGGYKVRMEEGRTPELYISPYYRRRLASGEITPAEREFIKRKVTAAQWLIDSIQQRRNTLRKVAQAIVDHQQAFLEKGTEAIEPLKMQQIADKVGVHVTTVSRAVDDKWIQTPRGIFPLKKFFGGGTKSADGEDVAWDSVRIRLQEIVDGENRREPFSDDALVEELAKHGFTVARRTVTKYRKLMKIPSSRERKDWSLITKASPNGTHSEGE
jgi:RNA polymerase sigma-54 factor